MDIESYLHVSHQVVVVPSFKSGNHQIQELLLELLILGHWYRQIRAIDETTLGQGFQGFSRKSDMIPLYQWFRAIYPIRRNQCPTKRKYKNHAGVNGRVSTNSLEKAASDG